MKDIVSNYVESKNNILKNFNCEQEFYIKPIEGYNWRIKELEGIYFLNYWQDNGNVKECVIVKKDGQPYITKNKDYTMIVCVECVKVAIIANNNNEV